MAYQEKHLSGGKTAVVIDEDSLHHLLYNSIRAFRFCNGRGPDVIIVRKLKCTSDIADGKTIIVQYEDETISNDEYWKSVGIKPGKIAELAREVREEKLKEKNREAKTKLKEKKTDVPSRRQRAQQDSKANEAINYSTGDSTKPDENE